MPLYYFFCETCGDSRNRILTPALSREPQHCKVCETILYRTPRGASSQTMEVLDSNTLVRPVVRYADAEQLFKERSRTIDDGNGEQ